MKQKPKGLTTRAREPVTVTRTQNHSPALVCGSLILSRFGAVATVIIVIVLGFTWLGGEHFDYRATEALASRGVAKVEVIESRQNRSETRIDVSASGGRAVP